MSYQLTTAKVWDGSAWADAVGGGVAMATVSATTGSPATGTFTDADGLSWNYYDFTGNGSITIDSAGFADVLIVGGGGGGARSVGSGRDIRCGAGGGQVIYGVQYLDAATLTVTIGSAGSGISSDVNAVRKGGDGSASTLGTDLRGNGGGGGIACGELRSIGVTDGASGSAGGVYISNSPNGTFEVDGGGSAGDPNNYTGLSLNYNGSAIEFAKGGNATSGSANTGSGGTWLGGNGQAGRVIVKVLA